MKKIVSPTGTEYDQLRILTIMQSFLNAQMDMKEEQGLIINRGIVEEIINDAITQTEEVIDERNKDHFQDNLV